MRVMRREGRGRMDRAAGAVAGVGQLYFKYRVPTVLYYEGGGDFSSIVHVRPLGYARH